MNGEHFRGDIKFDCFTTARVTHALLFCVNHPMQPIRIYFDIAPWLSLCAGDTFKIQADMKLETV